MNKLRTISIVVIAFILLVIGLGMNVQPAQAATCTHYYRVQKGDYLVKIGKMFGVNWRYLAEINNISSPWIVYPGQTLCVSTDTQPVPPQTNALPTFSIVGVKPDVSVTIQTHNFPANKDFVVRMGPMGTKAVGGYVVGSFNSGNGGSFQKTFSIPAVLVGSTQIAIRTDSTSGGYYAYNWFWNQPAGSGTGGGGVPDYTGIPTFKISAVVGDQTVTITTNNYPANTQFIVRMGPYGTKGVGGYDVGSFNSGAGGSFQATFSIPPQLAGSKRIAIRTDSSTGAYYAYNWFWNNTAP